jgi:hypothetical protein
MDAPRLRELRPGDLGRIVYSQGKGYAEQFGWNEEYEALIARIVADYAERHDPTREAGWIAELNGEPVGSIPVRGRRRIGREAAAAVVRAFGERTRRGRHARPADASTSPARPGTSR